MTVDSGSILSSGNGYIGYGIAATGVVNISGAGSTWSNYGSLYVGYSGSGTLKITGGGRVVNSPYNSSYIGYGSGSAGTVTVDGAGSTWTNNGCPLRRLLRQRNAEHHQRRQRQRGLRLHRLQQRFDGHGHGGRHRLDMDQQRRPLRRLLRQRNTEHHQRRQRQQYQRLHRLHSGSTGTVTVDGTGSTWTNSGDLYVGYSGSGTLNITNGGSRQQYLRLHRLQQPVRRAW